MKTKELMLRTMIILIGVALILVGLIIGPKTTEGTMIGLLGCAIVLISIFAVNNRRKK